MTEYEQVSGQVINVSEKSIFNALDCDINQIIPIKYPWPIQHWETGLANNWLPQEVPMDGDIKDWKCLSEEEKRFILIGLGFIGTAESLIANNIVHSIYKYVTNPECRQYLLRQAFEEGLHTWAFLYITSSLHIDQDVVFNMHKNVDVIAAKDEFAMGLTSSISKKEIDTTTTEGMQEFVKNLVGYYVIVEGIYFYGGFPMLLAPASQKKMQGLAKQIEFILKDESVHLAFGIDLINTIFEEYPQVYTNEFKKEIQDLVVKAVEYETKYIEFALRTPVFNLEVEDVVETVKFFANRRLEKLGIKPVFEGVKNKLGYLSSLIDMSNEVNTFDQINTSYRTDKLKF